MGGTMWVESEEGVGSTFYVTITARGSMQPSTGRSLSPAQLLTRPPTKLTGKRALLVGARGTFHRMVGSMLKAWGMEVSVAGSEAELSALASPPVENGVSRMGVWAAQLDPMEVDGTRGFDVVIVDSPVTERVFDNGKLEAMLRKNREAVELMRRGCALRGGLPTLLLTSKHTRDVFGLDSEAMVRRNALFRDRAGLCFEVVCSRRQGCRTASRTPSGFLHYSTGGPSGGFLGSPSIPSLNADVRVWGLRNSGIH